MTNFGKGCLGAIVCFGLFLLGLKWLLGEYFDILMMLLPLLLIIILGIVSSAISDLIKAGKWLGLGAIVGNIANNKINTSAAIKNKKSFRKKPFKSNISFLDKATEFISPDNDEFESELKSKEYHEFQEFLKWKQEKVDKKEND